MSDVASDKKLHSIRGSWLRRLLLCILLLILCICLSIMMGVKRIPHTSLDKYVRTDVYPADGGEVRHYDSNAFPSPLRGDRLVFTIQLSEVTSIPENPVLCFYNYNSLVSVSCGNRSLYSHGWKQKGQNRPTGHTIVRVPMPYSPAGEPTELSAAQSAESSAAQSSSSSPAVSPDLPLGFSSEAASAQTVTIQLVQMEDHTTSSLDRVELLPSQYGWLYPVLTPSAQINAVLFTLFYAASFIILCVLIVLNVRGAEFLKGIYLSLFCFFMTVWMMGYTGILFILTNNLTIAPYIEYYGIFLSPVFFYCYLGVRTDGRRKKVTHCLAAVSGGIFMIAFVWHEFVTVHSGFVVLLPVCYLELIMAAVVFLYYLHGSSEKGNKIMRWGITATFFIALLEIVRAFVIKLGRAETPLLHRLNEVVLTPYIVIALEVTLVADYVAKWYQMYLRQLQMDKLAAIAYTDGLTGLNNRSDFYEHEKPGLEGLDAYTIAFIDADGLKAMNDTYGHRAGDLLLIAVSTAIRYGCRESGCRAYRFGGDEFLIVGEIREEVEKAVASMKEKLAEEENPFTDRPVSASVGIAEYPTSGASLEDTLKQADRRMYEEKKKFHKARMREERR